MKKFIKYALGIVVVGLLCAFVIAKLTNKVPESTMTPTEKVQFIIAENSCLDCHGRDAVVPWYGRVPVMQSWLEGHINQGTSEIDLVKLLQKLETGQIPTEVELAKLEYTALANSMPIHSFKMMHWQSSLQDEELQAILDWAKETRQAHYATGLAAEEFANEPVQPMPASIATDSAMVALGKELYHDGRLSHDNSVSCATCHPLNNAGVDGTRTSKGIYDQWGGINAPTVYNSAYNFTQFWDGRAADLAMQIFNGPPLDALEMGSSWEEIVGKLNEDPEMVKRFAEVFEDGVTGMNVSLAIAEFEKTLTTPNTKLDAYLKGDKEALNADELAGYKLFKDLKCATCHAGVNLGGTAFEKMGIKGDYFGDRTAVEYHDKDLGRFGVTKDEFEKHFYKVPTLRNIALTAPYLHDGTAQTLEEAIDAMLKYECDKTVTNTERAQLVAFLNALTGSHPLM